MIISRGFDQARCGSYDLGMAYDEPVAGRACDCLRAAAGVGLNHG